MDPVVLELQKFVDDRLNGRAQVRVLEAGCGSASYLRFQSNAHLTGIDISPEQLEKNKLLHEKILGDLEEFTPPTL